MSDEQKKVELSDEDLELIAGGAFVEGQPNTYRCGMCCKEFVVTTRQEVKAHMRACPSNPNNFK